MTFKVIAEDEAKREWNKAVDWYEERGPGSVCDLTTPSKHFCKPFPKDRNNFDWSPT